MQLTSVESKEGSGDYLVESQVLDEDVLLALNALRRGWSGTQSHGLSYSIGLTDDRNASRLLVVVIVVVVVDDVAGASSFVVAVDVVVAENMLEVADGGAAKIEVGSIAAGIRT